MFGTKFFYVLCYVLGLQAFPAGFLQLLPNHNNVDDEILCVCLFLHCTNAEARSLVQMLVIMIVWSSHEDQNSELKNFWNFTGLRRYRVFEDSVKYSEPPITIRIVMSLLTL